MSSLVERLRVRSDRKPIYNIDESDDDADFLSRKHGATQEKFERIVRSDAVLSGGIQSQSLLGRSFTAIGGRGFLVPDDVYEALVKIGFMLDSPAFYCVCESFDQSKNGRFQLDDFISLCIFLQSTRNLFNSFDTAKQGRVTLDLNQFVYCRIAMAQNVGPALDSLFRGAGFQSQQGFGFPAVRDSLKSLQSKNLMLPIVEYDSLYDV